MYNNRFSHSPQTRPDVPFRRGLFKYVVLQYLQNKPGHGYEIIQALARRFHGFYIPSPGTVYPRLGRLEAAGLVTGIESEGRKVYTITDAGRRFLSENPGLEKEISERLSDWERPDNIEEIQSTMRAFSHLGEMLTWEVRKLGAAKLKRVQHELMKADKAINEIIQS